MRQDAVQVISAPGEVRLVVPGGEGLLQELPVAAHQRPEILLRFSMELQGQDIVQPILHHPLQGVAVCFVNPAAAEF